MQSNDGTSGGDENASKGKELSSKAIDPAEVELFARDEEGNLVPVEIDRVTETDGMHIVFAEKRTQHIGPLPSVEQFRAYGEVVPDAPERILQMAEKEQSAYHSFMDKQVTARASAITQGQWMGFIAMMVALLGAIYLALNGQTLVAAALASPAVITPIMRFYFQGKSERVSETLEEE